MRWNPKATASMQYVIVDTLEFLEPQLTVKKKRGRGASMTGVIYSFKGMPRSRYSQDCPRSDRIHIHLAHIDPDLIVIPLWGIEVNTSPSSHDKARKNRTIDSLLVTYKNLRIGPVAQGLLTFDRQY